MEFTEEKLKVLKAKHGKLFLYETKDGKSCVLSTPTLKIIDACRTIAGGSNIRFKTAIVENCWVEGDEEIKSTDKYLLGLFDQIDLIFDIVEGSLKEL